MLTYAVVTFAGLWLLIRHIPPQSMRRLVGYMALFDVLLHTGIILLFFGTFNGLMQAEAAGIMVSLYLRLYRWSFGFERYELNPKTGKRCWMRHPGKFTRIAT